MILSLKYKTLMSERQLDLRLTYKIFNFLHENMRRNAFHFSLL